MNLIKKILPKEIRKMKIDIDQIIERHELALADMQQKAKAAEEALKAAQRKQVEDQITAEQVREENSVIKSVKVDRAPVFMIEQTEELKELEQRMLHYGSEVARLAKKIEDLKDIKRSGNYDRIIRSK
jgi:predicted nucleic acid-binding protein